MKTDETNLVERIQKHIESVIVQAARGVEIVGDGEATIYPFVYRTDCCNHWLRGAFTNGDPIWAEADPELFELSIGEMFYRLDDDGNATIFRADGDQSQRVPGTWPIGSDLSGDHEHPEGITLTVADAEKIGIMAE